MCITNIVKYLESITICSQMVFNPFKHGFGKLFGTGSESKYFQVMGRGVSLATTYLGHYSTEAAVVNILTTGHGQNWLACLPNCEIFK